MKIGRTEIWFAFLAIFLTIEGIVLASLGFMGVIGDSLFGLVMAILAIPVMLVLYIFSKAMAPKNWETDERYMAIANSSLRHGLSVGFFVFIQLVFIEQATGWTIALKDAFFIVLFTYSIATMISRFIQERR